MVFKLVVVITLILTIKIQVKCAQNFKTNKTLVFLI